MVYLQYISAKIHSKCASQPKIAKKNPMLAFKVVQGHRCWYPRKARQMRMQIFMPRLHRVLKKSLKLPLNKLNKLVLVMILSESVSVCNHYRARLVDSSRNRTFSRGYPNLMRSYGGLRDPRGPILTPLKSTFNAEHFIRRLS